MAAATLVALPNEVLTLIINEAIPEGFDSLILVCRRLTALCRPFLKHHKLLRRHFRKFVYPRHHYGPFTDRESGVCSAMELIARIALEPVVARYIEHADFSIDGTVAWPDTVHKRWTDSPGASLVPKLFQASPYLQAAGIDWQDYLTETNDELEESRVLGFLEFSTRAAAFLLTLLPNVKVVRLPHRWKSRIDHVDKLLDSIVDRLKKP